MIHNIPFSGVNHRPTNINTPDGDLALCYNFINDNGSLSPLEKPNLIAEMPSGFTALYLHETASFKNLIGVQKISEGVYNLVFFDYNALASTAGTITKSIILENLNEIPTINSIGNTLIILFKNSPLQYAVYKDSVYTPLGSRPPFVQMKTGLLTTTTTNFVHYIDLPSGTDRFLPKSIKNELNGGYTIEFSDEVAEKISTFVLGAVNEHIAEYTKKGKFIFPFILRYALRLYDGSLVQQSFPVLLIPNSYLLASFTGNPVSTSDYATYTINYGEISNCQLTPSLADLGTQILKVPAELADWKDLVQSLDIFISAPIYTYDQGGKVSKISYNRDSGENSTFGVFVDASGEKTASYDNVLHLPRKDDDELQDIVESCSIFYKIHTIPFDSIKEQKDYTKVAIDGDKLATITSQEVMTDEYNSHQNTIAQSSFIYNNRLNLANISQEIIADTIGSTQISSAADAYKRFDLYTTISANNKSYTLQHPREYINDIYGYDGNPYSAFPRYIFYPHTGATNTIFRSTVDKIAYDMPMKEHSGLNGAVYFRGFGNTMPKIRNDYNSLPAISDKILVPTPNKIYTSAVENPFTFSPSNINTIGTGTIYALAAATQAISQGQFGAYPLYAFTSEGIWALQVSNTGGWSSIQPVSRDVITAGTIPCNLDNAVAFFTSQGLMMIQGGETMCISKSLNTDSPLMLPNAMMTSLSSEETLAIKTFPKSASIGYDYSHSRIYVFTKHITWIYSIKSGTWSHTYGSEQGNYSLNEYPNMMIVGYNTENGNQEIYSLSNDCSYYDSGEVLTRPITLNSTALRTIRTVISRGTTHEAVMGTVLYAVTNANRAIAIGASISNAVRRVSGSPYPAHCIHIVVSRCEDNFTLSHIELEAIPKHTNKLR